MNGVAFVVTYPLEPSNPVLLFAGLGVMVLSVGIVLWLLRVIDR